MQNALVHVRPICGGLSDAEIEMIVDASADLAIVDATYLPAGLDASRAVEWASGEEGHGWFVYCDEQPVGFYGLVEPRSTCGFDVPTKALEREVWLVDAARGRGLIRAVTELLLDRLTADGVEHIISVMAASNTPAIAAVAKSGFRKLGAGWWEHPGYDRYWCEVWILDLLDEHLDRRSMEDEQGCHTLDS